MQTFDSGKLTNLRNAKKLSQRELAEMIGVSQASIARWEAGSAIPDTNELIALGIAFDTDIQGFLTPLVPPVTPPPFNHITI